MSVCAYVCLRDKVMHSVSGQELSLEFQDLKPWEKHGYNLRVELPNGDLLPIFDVRDGLVYYRQEGSRLAQSLPLKDVQ